MASNEASPTNEETGFTFTPGQTKLIMNIIQHTTEHKYDADAIATAMGYKDRGVVNANWSRVKRNMAASPTGSGVKKSGGSGKKAGGRGKKVKAADGDDEEETPTKKGKQGTKAKEVDGDEEDVRKEKVKVEEKEGEGGKEAGDDVF